MNPRQILTAFLAASLTFAPRALAGQTSLAGAGMPAFNEAWQGLDYRLAATALASGKVPLPELSSEEGRKFFQRLTATEDFWQYRNRAIPIEQRISDFLDLLGGMTAIQERYLDADRNGMHLHAELVTNQVFLLRAASLGVELIEEMNAAVPPAERNAVRMRDANKLQANVVAVFFDGQSLHLKGLSLSRPDDATVLDALAETLPMAKRILSPADRTKYRQNFEGQKIADPKGVHARQLSRMINQLAK